MYHRVCPVRRDPWGLTVNPERFEEQIAFVKQHRTVMSLEEIVRRVSLRTLPTDAVAITLDDGYRDNLIHAKPILVRFGVPATLFASTGYIDRNEPFWWDELAAMILDSKRPVHDNFECSGDVYALHWREPEAADTDGLWRASDGPFTERQSTFLAIWRKLRRGAPEVRDLIMHCLRLRLDTPRDPLAMPMNSDEIRALLSEDLITLGAHGVTHSALTGLSRFESRQELEQSRQRCQLLSGKRVDGFSYPYGDMSEEVRQDVAAAGFGWACSTEEVFLDETKSSLYTLPRIAVPNTPLNMFLRLITAQP